MPELFTVLPPGEAFEFLCRHVSHQLVTVDVPTDEALGRILAESITAPAPLPSFARCTMDGYAVQAADTFGANESLPAYLSIIGEIIMGQESPFSVSHAQAALVYTGGVLPTGADAVVMVERTQKMDETTLEVLRPVAPGENVLHVGEDVKPGDPLFETGHQLRPQDLGGLMALGITAVKVFARPRVAIISTGDEVIAPPCIPAPGQIRDVNTYAISGQVSQVGGIPVPGGIIPDDRELLLAAAGKALDEADALIISAGSSVSTRDLTAQVINALGKPGVLVHGIAIRPGKPTILGVCNGKPVIGLPGNPVSAMVVAGLILPPLLGRLRGVPPAPHCRCITAFLTHNLSSVPGREDYVQVRIVAKDGKTWAEPVFGKSNLIYTLVKSDGLVRIPLNVSGLHQGEQVDVIMF